MTRLPHENWDVHGVAGPKYRVGPRCCIPDCVHLADHGHHLWRRSFLGKASSWVRLWDGQVHGNLVGLCYMHHQLVTEGTAAIDYVEGVFYWNYQWNGETCPLTPQPPVGGELGTASTPQTPEELTADREACPACGIRRRKTPSPSAASNQRRPRASWSLTVPADQRENGADVLDELCEGVMEAFGREYHTSAIARYFAVVEAFAFVIQHKHLLTEEPDAT